MFAALTASVTSCCCVDWLAAFSRDWIRVGIMSTACSSVSPVIEKIYLENFYLVHMEMTEPQYFYSVHQGGQKTMRRNLKMEYWPYLIDCFEVKYLGQQFFSHDAKELISQCQ